MARVTAPLLSFGATGQIAGTQVYSTWKGVPYVRKMTKPANPRSTEQTKTRSAFAWLNGVWKTAPGDFQAAWTLFAKGQPLTDRNAFIMKNLPILRGETVLTGFIMSPGAKGGLQGSITITPGVHEFVITGDAPDPLPAGWSVTRMIAAAIKAQNPQTDTDYAVIAGSDDSDPYSITLDGLTTADHWLVAGWFEFQKSSLATDLAYGPATAVDYAVG